MQAVQQYLCTELCAGAAPSLPLPAIANDDPGVSPGLGLINCTIQLHIRFIRQVSISVRSSYTYSLCIYLCDQVA